MRKFELAIILFALIGLLASIAWIVSSQDSTSSPRTSATRVSRISRLTPLAQRPPGSSQARESSGGVPVEESLGVRLAGRVVSRATVRRRLVALTFDDGPSRNLTSILALLDKYDARATFFVVSSRVKAQAGLVQRIVTGGSEVGNGSVTDLRLDLLEPGQIARKLDESQEAIRQVLGVAPPFLRPSDGRFNQDVLDAANKRNVSVVLWSLHSQDDGTGTASAIANRVVSSASPGDIVLMHETGKQTLKALPAILSKLKAKGYEVVSVGELLGAGSVP